MTKNDCVEHHWEVQLGDNRCRYCQMKYSYWLSVESAHKRGDITDEELKDWMCAPHSHGL